MTLASVAQRELLAAARRKGTHRLRLWVVALATVVTGFTFFFISVSGAGRQGGAFLFATLIYGCIAFAGFAGIFLTSDAIAEERREGTLGLLFLTNLHGFDVVGGKIVATGVHALSGMLAVAPFIATAWFQGGITGGEFGRSLLVLVQALFLSLSSGLVVSTLRRNQGQAVAWATILIGALFLLPLTFQVFAGTKTPLFPWARIADISPLSTLNHGQDGFYRLQPNPFWIGLGVQHLLSWFFLFLAGWFLHCNWRQSDPSLALLRGKVAPTATQLNPSNESPVCDSGSVPGTPQNLVQRRRRPMDRRILDREPLRALFQRNPWTIWLVRSMAALTCLLVALSAAAYGMTRAFPNSPFFEDVLDADEIFGGLMGTKTILSTIVWWVIRILFAWEATTTLAEARRNGAFELILTTPVKDIDVHTAHRRHLHGLFGLPIILIIAADFATIAILALQDPDLLFLQISGIFGLLLPLTQLMAMQTCGRWFALSGSNPMVAFGKTFLLCGIVPSLFCCAGFIPAILLAIYGQSQLSRPLRKLLSEPSA